MTPLTPRSADSSDADGRDPLEMHEWSGETALFSHSVIGYALERLRVPKDPQWGAVPAAELAEAIDGAVCENGIGGLEALRLFRDVLMPATRPMDDPMNVAYVPTAPGFASTMFDLVVSASSIFGGNWEAGAGAIAAENQALAWLAELAGFPSTAGGVFVSGGSAANLSALHTARHAHRQRHPHLAERRLAIAATGEVHSSVRAAAAVMDCDVVNVPVSRDGRMTGTALEATLAALDNADRERVFAVVATGGTTNAGVVDELDAIADVCTERCVWLHVDGAYGIAALAGSLARDRFRGIERADSFGVDPHKWLFAPYDCAALVYRDPGLATAAHAQHGAYLDAVNRADWNPSDYAYHLSRRARGLPLWFGLATHGTAAYTAAVDQTLRTAWGFAEAVRRHPGVSLVNEPELSVVLFRRDGWGREEYAEWSRSRAAAGVALVVPTNFDGEPCLRVCIVNPRTELAALEALLPDLTG